MSNREIAERLVLTINTVKWYNRQIYSKLDVGSRTQAIARAYDLQLLDQIDPIERSSLPPTLAPKHNLPSETTRFIGRKREIADIKRLVQTSRLLTLSGPPGTGKTRLSICVAREMINTFYDGVYLVSLAPIHDAMLVANAIANAIGVDLVPGQSILETLKHFLRSKQLLLVMDNFEHLLEAASLVSELLGATSHLQILTTSREALHLYGEQEYAVPLLELPDPEHLDPPMLASCESVALFVERAAAIQPDFELTAENALDIAKICVRLEGLPLAIELAAARVKLLPPRLLLVRLGNRLELLVSGPRDLPSRQRTLRQTIDWSYQLLSVEEKRLFAQLAMFRGGGSLEAIEAVCGLGLSMSLLEEIESLLNKSLLFQREGKDGEPHFVMLETIHEYAWEQLAAGEELDALRHRHAEYYVDFAERAEPELRRAGFSQWMTRLETEYDNLRAVLEWSFAGGEIELGLRLVAALRDYWTISGRFTEGEKWTQSALTKSESVTLGLQSRLFTSAGLVLFYSARRALGKQYYERAIELAREVNDRSALAWALVFLGSVSIGQLSEYEEALSYTEEGLAIFRELEHKPGMAQALNIIGELARTYGDDQRAQIVYEECLLLVHETGEVRRETMVLSNLGFIAMHQAEIKNAKRLVREALLGVLELGHDQHQILSQVVQLAGINAANGNLEGATKLFGAAAAHLDAIGVGLQPGNQHEYERDLAFARSQLDVSTFEQWWNAGQTMSFEQMLAIALEDT